jgi:hypothetical protein
MTVSSLIHGNDIGMLGKPVHHLQNTLLAPRAGKSMGHDKSGVRSWWPSKVGPAQGEVVQAT